MVTFIDFASVITYSLFTLGSEQEFKPTAEQTQKLRKLLYFKMTDQKHEFAKFPFWVYVQL